MRWSHIWESHGKSKAAAPAQGAWTCRRMTCPRRCWLVSYFKLWKTKNKPLRGRSSAAVYWSVKANEWGSSYIQTPHQAPHYACLVFEDNPETGNGLEWIWDPVAWTTIPFTFIMHAAGGALSKQTHPAEKRLQMGKYWATRTYLKSVFKILTAMIAAVTELKYFTHCSATRLLSFFHVSFQSDRSLSGNKCRRTDSTCYMKARERQVTQRTQGVRLLWGGTGQPGKGRQRTVAQGSPSHCDQPPFRGHRALVNGFWVFPVLPAKRCLWWNQDILAGY